MKCLCLIALTSVANAGVCLAHDLSGSWQLKSGEYLNHSGELINYKQTRMRAIKVYSPTHFSFTSMKGEEFWAAGTGTYSHKNGLYTETLLMNSLASQLVRAMNSSLR